MFKSRSRGNGFFKAACLGLALLTVAPAFANVTRVSELVDVDPNVWAYKALKELVEKYDVLEGYPDKTFRGNKPATRYEMAQALYEVLKAIDGMGVSQIDSGDAETVGKLKKLLDKELADVRNQLASLDGRVSALEAGSGQGVSVSSWTDRIRLSGDLTNQFRQDVTSTHRNSATWGTRGRLGVDATLIADDANGGHMGEGIAHLRINGGNGGPGTFGYDTTGNNLDDILFDGSNPASGSNNSLFGSRTQDSRMDVYLDQAYYTQVFKFSKSDPCTNETKDYPNFFAVVDLGQQDLWNTFHKSLVREDSLDGFINQRVLHGVTGASDAVTEALHIGLNWLGDSTQKDRTDACGNVKSAGVDSCGNALPGFFQAFSLDYAVATHKANHSNGATVVNDVQLLDLNGDGVIDQYEAASTGDGVYTTDRAVDNLSHSIAANLLYDLPGEFLGTGLFTVGASAAHLDTNGGVYSRHPITATLYADSQNDDWGYTVWTKLEQYFGKNRTFGLFADYSYSNDSNTNRYLSGQANHLAQLGAVLNTTFMPTTWNFNKDQIGLAFSYMFSQDAPSAFSHYPTSATPGWNWYTGNAYIKPGDRDEQILEAYYRKYITENISITPDVMVQFNGNGHNTAVSASLRSTFKLPNWNDGGAFDQFGYRDWSQRIAKYKAAHSSME